MKKNLYVLFAVVLALSLCFVVADSDNGARDGTGAYHDEVVAAGGQGGEGPGSDDMLIAPMEKERPKLGTGAYLGEEGKEIRVQEKEENRVRLQVGNMSADCDCNLTQEQVQNRTRIYAKLSNGRNAEVKVMPDSASEVALNRLRLKVCNETNNCSLTLKEVGEGEKAKFAYELQTQRQSRLFGLFGTTMQVQAQVDAETGEVIQTNKPWWAFLATEPEETSSEESSE